MVMRARSVNFQVLFSQIVFFSFEISSFYQVFHFWRENGVDVVCSMCSQCDKTWRGPAGQDLMDGLGCHSATLGTTSGSVGMGRKGVGCVIRCNLQHSINVGVRKAKCVLYTKTPSCYSPSYQHRI